MTNPTKFNSRAPDYSYVHEAAHELMAKHYNSTISELKTRAVNFSTLINNMTSDLRRGAVPANIADIKKTYNDAIEEISGLQSLLQEDYPNSQKMLKENASDILKTFNTSMNDWNKAFRLYDSKPVMDPSGSPLYIIEQPNNYQQPVYMQPTKAFSSGLTREFSQDITELETQALNLDMRANAIIEKLPWTGTRKFQTTTVEVSHKNIKELYDQAMKASSALKIRIDSRTTFSNQNEMFDYVSMPATQIETRICETFNRLNDTLLTFYPTARIDYGTIPCIGPKVEASIDTKDKNILEALATSSTMRRIRGDGNCCPYSFATVVLESLLENKTLGAFIDSIYNDGINDEELKTTITCDLLDLNDTRELESFLKNNHKILPFTKYLRLLAADEMKNNPNKRGQYESSMRSDLRDSFPETESSFKADSNAKSFETAPFETLLSYYVLRMGTDFSQPAISALCSRLKFSVKIMGLRGYTQDLVFYFDDSNTKPTATFCRNGAHYFVLYPKQNESTVNISKKPPSITPNNTTISTTTATTTNTITSTGGKPGSSFRLISEESARHLNGYLANNNNTTNTPTKNSVPPTPYIETTRTTTAMTPSPINPPKNNNSLLSPLSPTTPLPKPVTNEPIITGFNNTNTPTPKPVVSILETGISLISTTTTTSPINAPKGDSPLNPGPTIPLSTPITSTPNNTTTAITTKTTNKTSSGTPKKPVASIPEIKNGQAIKKLTFHIDGLSLNDKVFAFGEGPLGNWDKAVELASDGNGNYIFEFPANSPHFKYLLKLNNTTWENLGGKFRNTKYGNRNNEVKF